MNKFVRDLKEVGRDIKNGVYFVYKICRQIPFWISEVIDDRKKSERKIKYFTSTATDICRIAYDD